MKKIILLSISLFLLSGCTTPSPDASVSVATPQDVVEVDTEPTPESVPEPVIEEEPEEVVQEEPEVAEFDRTAFTSCLTTKGVKMYGTEWCSHCQNQKKFFGDDFKNVDYVDCDLKKNECQQAGITGYPTWVFADDKRTPGEQSFEKLAKNSGCSL